MILYLLRHEKAVKRDGKIPDAERKLMAQGKQRAFRRANKFKKKLSKVDLIVTSPHARAFETAEIFASVLGKKDFLKSDVQFGASASAKSVFDHLSAVYKKYSCLLVVGHGPWLNDLVSLMISGTYQTQVKLKIGSITRVEIEIFQPQGATLSGLW